ncbi:MAG: Mu transposase C-terminal domain-containing protein [Anaerovoracaceae bacterium]
MSEIFLRLEEAAEIENATYETFKKRIQRNQDKFIIKKEKSENGGKDIVWVGLSSLSPKAQKTYKKKYPIGEEELVLVEQVPKAKMEEIPWYMDDDFDFNWYTQNYPKQYEKGLEISKNIKAFLDYDEADRTRFAEEFAASMGISQRTLYRYAQSFLEAEKWVLYKLKETGKTHEHYKVLAMCRKPKGNNKFPSLNAEHRAFIENLWFNADFSRNNGTVEMLYAQFERFFKENNKEYPSYKTVTRYINYLMTEGGMSNAKALAARGLREWKRNNMLKGLRDSSKVPVMGILQGDSHTFDFWVQYRDPNNGKVSAIRPTMVAWIDTRSRVIMGDVWAKTVNAQVIKQSMAKVVYQYGVPECIIIDNGKDYTAKEMTGRSRKQRHGGIELDEEATAFYKSIGIKDDYRALPYQPWVKIIERAFGTVCQQFSKWMGSYTGTLTGSKTAAKVEKDIKKLLKEDKLLSMEEAFQMWELYLREVYHQKEHGGLKKMKEKYTKPMELFENAEERISIPPPKPELIETLLLKPSKARIYQTGINKFGHNYMNYELATYKGETLPIRYDPMDMSKLHVFDKNGRKICVAESRELLGYQRHITEQQLIEHLKLQKRQEREDKLRLEAATTPYELRGHDGDPLVTGSLNFMIEKKKAELEALPQEEEKSEPISEASDYFQNMAKKELKKLREMNRED